MSGCWSTWPRSRVGLADTRSRLDDYLERFDLAAYRKKKVKELSKGMQQKAQIISTLIHQPELLIIDEPFSGLDPVNTQMVKDLLGICICTVLLSSCRPTRCTRSRNCASASCSSTRDAMCSTALSMRSAAASGECPAGALTPGSSAFARDLEYRARERRRSPAEPGPRHIPPGCAARAGPAGLIVEEFEVAVPTLDEIFIRVVSGQEQLTPRLV